VATEHKSILDTCKKLEKQGCQITILPVDQQGMIDLDQLRSAITPKTILVSVMTANNEIGTIQDIQAIGALCRERSVMFHTDASQAIGKIPVEVSSDCIDLMSFTGHKVYGPKGIGALYVKRSNVRLAPQMEGGGHERGMRSGTLNVPGIVGLAKALEISLQSMEEESGRISGLRDTLFGSLSSRLEGVSLNGHPAKRLPNNLNVSFDRVEDSALMMSMKDVAVSTGSACSTANPEPSHVLKALKLPADRLHSAIRFGLGRFTTGEEVDYVADRVVESVGKLRELSPPSRNRVLNREEISSH
jgi:cysteine desulfurase